MNSSGRHARKKNPLCARPASALLRAGLTVTAAGAVVTGAGGAASAADGQRPAPVAEERAKTGQSEVETASGGLTEGVKHSVGGLVGTVKNLQLNPLAKTGVDPLDNVVSTRIADFKPLSTEVVTGPLADGASLDELPVVGGVVQQLPG